MTQMHGFDPPPGSYLRFSGDGSAVVGNLVNDRHEGEAFRWTAAGGMNRLGPRTTAADLSADGSVVAGAVNGRAARWTVSDGWLDLGATWDDMPFSRAHAVSADGSTVVGEAYDVIPIPGGQAEITEAFRWTASSGAVRMGFSGGIDVSTDGSVVVGWGGVGSIQNFIWDQTHGMRSLKDVLEELGADLAGVEFGMATAIAADGRTIVGPRLSDDGTSVVGFVATVPEPAGLAVLALAMAAGRRRGRPRDWSCPRPQSV
jgi:MYXO-CTERM domain-containing protein